MTVETRYRVFLSHNSADKTAVEELARRLDREGILPWLDKWNLIPGELWQEAIEKALGDCETCAIFIGPSGAGPWQNEEMRAAIQRRVDERRTTEHPFRVIPVLLPGAERGERSQLPTFLAATTWVEFRHTLDDGDAFHRLVCGIRGVEPGPGPGQAIYEGECPYRGLRVFDVQHAPFFFGREALTDWLLNELRPSTGKPDNRFLAIIGASGSGKSSLARAGLVAALKRGEMTGSNKWPIAICRPGPDPLESLAIALSQNTSDALGLMGRLRDDERTLHIATRLMLRDAPPEHRFVMLVDQFEEVFTLCHNEELRNSLINNLLYAARVAHGKTVVLLTLRADFYGKCASYPALAAALSDHQMLVGIMTDDELRRAIERPAQLAGYEFEAGLVEVLLRDVKDQPGSLPLLQHALLELWARREGRRLTHTAYKTIGGVVGALEQRAETVYRELNETEKKISRRIFLRLTQPGEGTEDTKRRAMFQELLPANGLGHEALEGVIQKLAGEEARLVTMEGEGERQRFVEIAHEALIRGWPRLRAWVEEDRESLRLHRQLTEVAREWEQHGMDESYLYRGGRLAVIEEWGKTRIGDLNELERAFLEASITERQREQEKQRELHVSQGKIAEHEAMLVRSMLVTDFVHRMTNLAGTIPAWANLIRDHLTEHGTADEKVEGYIDGIERDAAGILNAAEELEKPVEKQPVDVKSVLNSLIRQAGLQIQPTIHIALSCEKGVPSIYALASELKQALWSIIENGIAAMPDGGNLEIGCANGTDGTGRQWIEITVRDEGGGISEEASKKIFSLFYTTKQGHMGYGLWRSRSIIEGMDGEIEFHNNADRGTTFVVRLPVSTGG